MSQDLADSTGTADVAPDGAERALVVKRFGPLEVCVVSRYTRTWDDRGSGGDYHGSFFSPVAPGAGWRRLSHLGNGSNHDDIGGNHATVMVREVDTAARLLAHPVDYRLIWNDEGSGASKDGAVWRPVPPAGYVALSDVMWQGHGKPPLTEITCVRKSHDGRDYVRRGTIGPLLWSDQGTGADRDVSLYPILATAYPDDTVERLLLPTGGFTAYGHHGTPQPRGHHLGTGPARLDREERRPAAAHPDLARRAAGADPAGGRPGRGCPVHRGPRPALRPAVADRQLAVLHPGAPTLLHPPDPPLQRRQQPPHRRTGTHHRRDRVPGGDLQQKTSTTVELGYERRRGVSLLHSETKKHELVTPPRHSGCLWSETHEIRSFRADGGQVGDTSLIFETSNYVNQQYPAGTDIRHTVTD